MPPVADTRLPALTDLGATESTIILATLFLLLLASALICTSGCCSDQEKNERYKHGDNVVEQPPDTKSISDGSDGDTRGKGRKRRKKKDWANLEEKQPRRPIMPVTAELIVLPENQKYMKSWSASSKTESVTMSAVSEDTRARSKKSPKASDGLKVVLKYNLTRPRKDSNSSKSDM